MTPAIGILMVFWGSIIVIVTTVITGIVKAAKRKKTQK